MTPPAPPLRRIRIRFRPAAPMPDAARPLLELVPADGADPALLAALARDLDAVAGVQCRVGPAMYAPPAEGVDAGGPYPSILLMHALMDRRAAEDGEGTADWSLAITESALCAEGIGAVFGEAAMDGCCAVVGLAPLRAGSGADADVLRGRLLVEALHELGHLAGVEHCRRASCVMYPSLHIAHTDQKSPAFCADCASSVTWRVTRKT